MLVRSGSEFAAINNFQAKLNAGNKTIQQKEAA